MASQINRMFGGKNEDDDEAAKAGSPQGELREKGGASTGEATDPMTYIGKGSAIEGKITCKGPTRLGGSVSGEVVADDRVEVDAGAEINANLNVKEAVISGQINGNVVAEERITLASSACIAGDISTPRLSMQEGAQVRGKIDVSAETTNPAASAQPRPAPSIATHSTTVSTTTAPLAEAKAS
ncbi:MAG: polymer-forming cytoskeletal protein [Pseudomonadota bacterium]